MKVVRPTPEVLQIKAQIEAEGIFTKEVSDFGNGAKIDFIKKFIGRKVIVIVMKEDGK